MIGTIRKHSKWLWWVIAALTIISFIGWNLAPVNRNNGGGGSTGFGTLYGHKITQQDYINGRNEFFLSYWFRNHEWPDKNPNFSQKNLDEQIYLQMMLGLKADALGIQVSDETAGGAAGNLLRSLGSNGRTVTLEEFNKQVLAPANMTIDDFEHFVHNDLAIEQLSQTMGMAGTLVTPQEAATLWRHDHQQVTAQFVLFSASNFVSQVSVTPAAVAQFYTNYMAQYRLPERVSVDYVEFNISNYFAAAEQTIGKTNLNYQVDALFRQNGMAATPDAKTPEESKAQIRDYLIRKQASSDALKQANALATEAIDQTPARAENLATAAKQKGLPVRLTAPFSSRFGPEEFTASTAFTKAAFALTDDEPIAGPVAGSYAYYVIALDKKLDSVIPSLDEIHDQVTGDFRMTEAAERAQRAGTNFAAAVNGQLISGHTFASTCIAAGLHPQTLPTFSLSTQDLPELADQVELSLFLRIVANTQTGLASSFVPTSEGGLIVFVQSRQPADQTAMKANLPQYTAALRRQRQSEAFNQWVQGEANRQLRTTPVFAQQTAGAAK